MPDADVLASLRCEIEKELTDNLLPYWIDHTIDERHGGFVGQIDQEGNIVEAAPKGAVLNARILWTFAAAYRILHDAPYLQVARRANAYLNTYFWDAAHEGIFWSLDHLGRPFDEVKKIYAQSFAVYGLAEYHRATGDAEALRRAVQLFKLIERHGYDTLHGGYFEAFSRTWGPLDDVRLSTKDLNAPKSMNTHLHVLEAYTNLYRAWPNILLFNRLQALVELFLDTIIDTKSHHLHLFFDNDWRLLSKTVSFGHDIEASWLLIEAADVLDQEPLKTRVLDEAMAIARTTRQHGQDQDGGLFYEIHEDGHLDADKHWWPQAEAVVGFLNAYEKTGAHDFLEAAVSAWTFIKKHVIDRAAGEWFGRVSRDGVPYQGEDKVGIWKCPYHNARTCLEVIARTEHPDQVHPE